MGKDAAGGRAVPDPREVRPLAADEPVGRAEDRQARDGRADEVRLRPRLVRRDRRAVSDRRLHPKRRRHRLRRRLGRGALPPRLPDVERRGATARDAGRRAGAAKRLAPVAAAVRSLLRHRDDPDRGGVHRAQPRPGADPPLRDGELAGRRAQLRGDRVHPPRGAAEVRGGTQAAAERRRLGHQPRGHRAGAPPRAAGRAGGAHPPRSARPARRDPLRRAGRVHRQPAPTASGLDNAPRRARRGPSSSAGCRERNPGWTLCAFSADMGFERAYGRRATRRRRYYNGRIECEYRIF